MPASAALDSLYRLIESGEADLCTAPEPPDDPGPRDNGVYFGSQVGWSPDREGGSKLAIQWACDLDAREVLVVELCPVCLSDFLDVKLPHGVVCMGCLRSSHDSRIRAILAADDMRIERARPVPDAPAPKLSRKLAGYLCRTP
jgi:hypothetical protein